MAVARQLSAMVFAVGMAASFASAAARAEENEIVIGTSMPLAGAFGQFGQAVTDGYTFAVEQINAGGGVDLNGVRHKIKLIVLDNQSDANQVAGQVRKLVARDGVVALLGAVNPAVNTALSAAADQLQIPLVLSQFPIKTWLSTRDGGYKFAWDIYADEPDAASVSWKAADLGRTNKKVAIFATTDMDGDVWAKYWKETAPAAGYQIVYEAKMPGGVTNFESYIRAAQEADAEVLLGQIAIPDSLALWKQMKALGYSPKIASCEKCASGNWWPDALGPVAEGTLTSDIWIRGSGGPQAEAVVEALGSKHAGKVIGAVVAAHTTMYVLVDAIGRAGSTDPAAINAEIAKTDKLYGLGHVKFDESHGAGMPSMMLQWQKGEAVRVYPSGEGAMAFEFPVPGLQ